MTRILAITTLALALPMAASASPMFLPELTFPEPVSQPDVSSQGCASADLRPCR